MLFTTSPDLTAEFPALAARQLGWLDVPLMCGHEMNVPGALQRVCACCYSGIRSARSRKSSTSTSRMPCSCGPTCRNCRRWTGTNWKPGSPSISPTHGQARKMSSFVWTYLVPSAVFAVAAGLLYWQRSAWQMQQARFADTDLEFARGQFRRRTQTSAILGLLALGMCLGQLIPRTERPTLFVLFWVGLLLLLAWMVLRGAGRPADRTAECSSPHAGTPHGGGTTQRGVESFAQQVRRAGDGDI